jgi:subtilase family serine protease
MSLVLRCSVLLGAVLCPALSFSQSRSSIQQDRVAVRPDLRARTKLHGHVPSWVANSYDIGSVRSDAELNVTFVLSRGPEQQAQFEQLLSDQQNPDSSRYHQWLTPQQVGEQYGPTQHDLDALREWLSSQGLTVREVAPSGMFVHVSGAASSMGFALGTEFHYFQHNGTRQMSATEEPAIPAALAPIVASISGLAEVEIRPTHHIAVRSASETASASSMNPQFTSNGNHYITPGDFAAIFDLKPVYSAGYTGTGQKVAVIGRSRVAGSDITAFESTTGLAANLPNTVIPSNGIDPGMTNDDDQVEATLDVERVVGVAPGAQVDLVVSRTSANSDGVMIAAQYEVQMLRDPVMNISFGGCEGYSGAPGVQLWDTLFAQAASEGISVFVSSGDVGAAACDGSAGVIAPVTQFLSINNICSSSYVTCVGGTEFADFSNPSQFWSSTNSTGLASALGYIPEGAWNESTSYVSSLGGYTVAGGGGGASIYVPKPSWQTGTGVPADHARDVPDISFPAAGHDGYYVCLAVGNGNCTSDYWIIYGTSASAPSMAGVAAILNQKIGGAQGNINPLLYKLAGTNPNAFHDATPTSSGVYSCSVTTPSICNNSTPATATLTGGVAGYSLTTGYDQATGLGSLDVANFVAAASAAAHSSIAPTTLTVHGSATTINNKQTAIFSAAVSSTKSGTPTGTVQFYANGSALGAPVTLSSATATTAALSFSSAGTYYITAMYTGDKNYAGSTAPGFSFVVTGLTSVTTVTASSTSIPFGTTGTFSTSVTPSSGTTTPTGTVRFWVLGTMVASVQLVNGHATTPAMSAPPIGSYTVTAEYLGDSIYSPSTSAPFSFSVTKRSPIVQISSTTDSIGTGGGGVYGINVGGAAGSSASSVAAPTGTVQMYLNGVALGSPILLGQGGQTTSPAEMFSTAGTNSLTAFYSGDANWLAATSNAVIQTVLPQPATFQMAPTTPTIAVAAGNTTSNTVNLTGSLGFTGMVNLTCTVAYNGTGTVNDLPQCLVSNGTFWFSPTSSSFQPTITLSSTAPQASNLSVSSRRLLDGWNGTGAVGFCAVMLWLVPTRRTNLRVVVTALILLAGLTTLSGCGGSGAASTTPTTPSGTTRGSYTVTIAATTTSVGAAVPPPLTISLTIN